MKFKQIIMLITLVLILCCCALQAKHTAKLERLVLVHNLSLNEVIEKEVNTNTINFSGDQFYFKIMFTQQLTKQQVKELITIKPQLNYNLFNTTEELKSDEWCIQPLNWQVNDQAIFSISSSNKTSLNVTKVSTPQIMNKIIIAPWHRYDQPLLNNKEQVYIMNESKVRYVFNKAMNKSSVTELITKAVVQSSYAVNCNWESDTSLVIQFIKQNKVAEIPIKINLTGALDAEDALLIDKSLQLKLVTGEKLAKYNDQSELGHSYSYSYNISQAQMSYLGDKIVLCDVVAKSTDLLNIRLKLLNSTNYELLMEQNCYSPINLQRNLTWSALKYFFYKDTVYSKKGEKLLILNHKILAADFSADESKLVVLVKDDTTTILVYDIKTKEKLFERKLTVVYSNDQKPKIFFIDNDNILYEQDHRLKKINVNTNSISTLLNGSFLDFDFNNLLSPSKGYLLYQDKYGKQAIYSITKNKELYSFKDSIKSVSWLYNSDAIAFNTTKYSNVNILDIKTQKLKVLAINGIPLGWDQENNLQILIQ